MPLHYIAWNKALDEWNCEFEEKLFYAWGGTPIAEIIAALNEKHALRMPVEAVARRKRRPLSRTPSAVDRHSRSLGAHPRRARPHPLRGRLGKHQGICDRVFGDSPSARSIRHLGLCRRLQEKRLIPKLS
jgi:hypothetical protein